MVGHSATEFLYPADLDATREEMREARRGRIMRNFDCRYVHKDGRVVPLTWTGVWSEPDQQHFFIGRDMTERLAAEERLRRAQRLEAVGQLTGGIAHDFNNLLALIIGNIELMFDEPDTGPQVMEYGRAALHAAQRGADLTRGLLAFSRKQSLEPKVVDVNGLIGNLATLLGRTLGQNIEVTFTGAPNLSPVFVDPANLESAVANLAVNARDAMPGGGRLMIETCNETLDRDYVTENPEAEPGDYASVTVTDTGTGMRPEILSRIFEPFFTTKEAGKGTGLGLSMVFGFVKQSGGHIKAYSEIGHGTSFRLYLPRAKGKGLAEATPAAAEPLLQSTRHERILVVEDNAAIRQIVLIQLAKLGYRPLEADGPLTALKLLDTGEPVDLLFTDVIMLGDMSGHALASEAVARRPGLKVLLTSGFPGAALAGNSAAVGGHTFLLKPYRLQDLGKKVRAALES
jgi:signal transduction histidine kinase/CheY-like chemotaxis protein